MRSPASRFRRLQLSLALAGLGLLCSSGLPRDVRSQQPSQDVPEYVLKAGFLYNFAKYVEWPEESFATAETPISIGVVGADPFGVELENTLANKTINGRRFEIHRYRQPEQIEGVHILFVPHSENGRMAAILERVRNRPVLTVGEHEGFPRRGGVVAIVIEERRPTLQINPEAAEVQKLEIASKLLKVARIVKNAE
jgi:hypothetical protein